MKEIISLLKEKNLKISTAESCTGGLLASAITDVSGASSVFELGIVSYSNEVKIKELGVRREVIEKFGVYSNETAAEMAKCVRKKAEADIGIGITGVAGEEPQEGVPAGKVFIALATPCGCFFAETDPLKNPSRKEARERALNMAISLIKKYLKNGIN